MQIVHSFEQRQFHLKDSFLAPYFALGDPFETLLARSTYVTKYARDQEKWTDTIRRVVEGNISLSPKPVSEKEAEMLFHLFWTGQALPPGRGLWTGGVPGIPADARFNCWYTTLYGPEDWCWVMNQLMLGGGVGVGINSIDRLEPVAQGNARFAINCGPSHPDFNEVKPNDKSFLNGATPVYRAEDSRQGWVESLRRTMQAAWEGRDLIVDVSEVRPRGRKIKIFGGIACGPGPLSTLLRMTWETIRGAAGRKLSSIECLDITNMIGFCVKSGNVRRSALIILGDAHDQEFRDAKKDFSKVLSHRHTSNNSIMFRSEEQIRDFDWKSLVDDNIKFGEPGLFNLPLVQKTDPGARGVNPCGEQALEDREACNLGENFPGRFESGTDSNVAFRLQVRYCMRQRLTPLTDQQSHSVGLKNMRIGVALGGLCDFDWTPQMLSDWFKVCRTEANDYADEMGLNRPITVTTVKPSGTISLLNGSSPGIHAPYAPWYIRRARIALNDPMAPALREAGVPCEVDQYDQTGHTLVFSFPTKARHTRTTVATDTIRDQFERQATVQRYWADNAVSSTLSFNAETEREETAKLLEEYVPQFKSTSMLAKTSHGYVQAPYEEIDEPTFNELYSQINHQHPLVRGGDIEVDECSSGACPMR